MPAPAVRADYDQLQKVASTFRQNVEAAQRSLQSIRSNMQTLQGGDWIGQGANAFYDEMEDSVLPTLQRLINALDSAANSTTQISSIMKNAEDQAANVLKGPGGGAGASRGYAASAAAGPGFGAAGGLGAATGPMGAPSAPAGGVSPDFSFQKSTAGSGQNEWIKASGTGIGAQSFTAKLAGNVSVDGKPIHKASEAAPQFSQAAGNMVGGVQDAAAKMTVKFENTAAGNIGFPQADAASKDAAKMTMGAGNVTDGLSGAVDKEYEWIKASDVASPKIDSNIVGGQIKQTFMNGGKTASDDWSQQTGGGANTIGGAAARDDWLQNGGAGQNTIGGATQDNWGATGQRQHDPANFKVGGDLGSSPNEFGAAAAGEGGGAVKGGSQINWGDGSTTAGTAAQDEWGNSVKAWAAGGDAAPKVNEGIPLRDLSGSNVSSWTIKDQPKSDGDKDDKP